ncbi:MAG: hypothetical protein RIF33_14155 [Cyclobacteriaceae bacterium]
MKNISKLLAVLTIISLVFSSCEDEDVQRFPDFVVPVVLLAQNVTGTYDWDDLDNSVYSFTLEGENFDGSADGHKFFVGRSGTTSTLIDVTLMISYNQGDIVEWQTLQGSELPAQLTLTPAEAASITGSNVSRFQKGDAFQVTYLYRIDENNSGTIRELATPGVDYCGGTTNEGEFCQLVINVTGDALSVDAFQAQPDTVLRAGTSDSVIVQFSNALTALSSVPAITANNGTLIELSRGGDSIIFRYDASMGFTGNDIITIDSTTIVAPTGNIDAISASTLSIAVDDDNPEYEFESLVVGEGTATLLVALSETLVSGATISVVSDSFEDLEALALTVTGTTGSVQIPIENVPSTLTFSFTIDGEDIAGNETDEAAAVNVTISTN